MLQELIAYTETRLPSSEPGFTTREIRWFIELTGDGRFLNIVPLGDGKRGQRFNLNHAQTEGENG